VDNSSSKRILIVDDDGFFSRTLQLGLDPFFYTIKTVPSGEAAIDFLKNPENLPIDAILLDQIMKGMDGLTTFLKIQELGINTPVIMMTGCSSVTLATEFLKEGGDDFIEKPIAGFEILNFKIRRVIEKYALRHALEQSMIEQAAMKEATLREFQFVTSIAHDIRSPLGGVKTGIDAFLKHTPREGNERIIDFLAKAQEGMDRVTSIICNTLALSVLRADQYDYSFTVGNLLSAIHDAITDSRTYADGKGISIHFDKAEDVVLPFDRSSMYRVFSNLIGNAVKFSESGEDISISIVDDGRLVTVAITDHGMGIPEEDIERIFGRFVRTSRARREREGCGIGLAICYEMVLAHQGKIWAENNSTGKGSTFYVELPRIEKAPPNNL